MQTRVSEAETWMTQNKLKMNDKTGSPHEVKLTFFLFFSPDGQLTSLRVGTVDILFVARCACNLGFISDSTTLDKHISTDCHSASVKIGTSALSPSTC